MKDAVIEITNLHKYYSKVHALRGLNLLVHLGEVFGFLGPNGAGKTTTIRCMLDLIRPNQGAIKIFGIDPQESPQAVKAMIGYLPGDLNLEGDFTPRSFINHIRRLRKDNRPWVDLLTIAKRIELDLDTKIKNLSQGNKQKVGFLQSFVGDVPLLVFDEPTLGLDPLTKQEVLNIIREAADQGKTVFFSSHILSEVQKIADRVGIIRKGKLVEIAQTVDLINRAINQATIQFAESVQEESFDHLPNVSVLRVNQNYHAYTLEVTGEMDGLIKTLAKYPVRDVAIHRPSLEEVFLKYYKDESTEG
jgi:ABC-2 type transport system ATP-binding protein